MSQESGNDKGLYATMIGGRIDPSSCLDTCWVDDMAVWWFRATCFHGLKYLCVNREVLKQNFIMKTEMKASNECLYPTDVFLVSCGMGCKRITVSDVTCFAQVTVAHDLVTELLQYSSLACFMPIWQLCANLLIPNCLRSNLSYSPLAALELYVNKTNSLFYDS